ncbi:transposase [Gimesia benthica]|uniref:Transposase n=1 Tax=Gimesia benthica TaxID=2608982 RepID=A0A6I6ALB5_9PLAN|nr:transposase [Gimesia benthica]
MKASRLYIAIAYRRKPLIQCPFPCFLIHAECERYCYLVFWKGIRSIKRKRYTEEQIAFVLRQAESGTTMADVTRKMGISEQAFYRWSKKYAGMGVAELRRLKQLEEENKKLKQLVADLSLDKKTLQDVVQGKA